MDGLCGYLRSSLSLPALRNEILWSLVFLLAKEEEVVDAMITKDNIIEVAEANWGIYISFAVEYYTRDSSGRSSRVRERLHCSNSLSWKPIFRWDLVHVTSVIFLSGPCHWMDALMTHETSILNFLHAMIVREGGEDSAQIAICKVKFLWILNKSNRKRYGY